MEKEITQAAPFIRSLVEARIFRYEGDFSNKSVPSIAKALMLMMLMAQVFRLYNQNYIQKYAKDTFFYGDFEGVRSYATDLHNIIAALKNKDIRSQMSSDNGLSVPEFAIKRYFRDIMSGARTPEKSLDRQFFYGLQSDLKISDAAISMIRRILVDVERATSKEYLDAAERVNRMLDNLAIYTDIQWEYKTNVRQKLINKLLKT